MTDKIKKEEKKEYKVTAGFSTPALGEDPFKVGDPISLTDAEAKKYSCFIKTKPLSENKTIPMGKTSADKSKASDNTEEVKDHGK